MKKGELQIQVLKGEILQVNDDEKTLSGVAKIHGWEYEENKAIANKLVHRWNSHDVLLRACEVANKQAIITL